MDRRDSPDFEPIEDDEPAPNPGRRFARLVASPATRRVALPRLLMAAALALGLFALLGIGVKWLFRSIGRWVDERPEHQIRFDRIELDPPPDPWIKGGAEMILEQVREGSGLGETIALLDHDLKGLEQDFRRSPWVKDVLRLDRSNYRRLIVSLVYRKPVAILEYGKAGHPYVLDEEAVVLDDKKMEWAFWKDPYRPQGMDSPLIKIIRGSEKSKDTSESMAAPKFGLPIKRIIEGDTREVPDPLILGATRLAWFLLDRERASPPEKPAIQFKQIYLPVEGPAHSYFILESKGNLIEWGRAPGDDKPGMPSSEVRWKKLMDWFKENGTKVLKRPDFLHFTGKEFAIVSDRSSRPK